MASMAEPAHVEAAEAPAPQAEAPEEESWGRRYGIRGPRDRSLVQHALVAGRAREHRVRLARERMVARRRTEQDRGSDALDAIGAVGGVRGSVITTAKKNLWGRSKQVMLWDELAAKPCQLGASLMNKLAHAGRPLKTVAKVLRVGKTAAMRAAHAVAASFQQFQTDTLMALDTTVCARTCVDGVQSYAVLSTGWDETSEKLRVAIPGAAAAGGHRLSLGVCITMFTERDGHLVDTGTGLGRACFCRGTLVPEKGVCPDRGRISLG